MSCLLQLLCFLSLPWPLLSASSSNQIPQQYVVYMGSSAPNGDVGGDEMVELDYVQFLSSIIPSNGSERIRLIHYYSHSFKGFSAMLTKNEASFLSGVDGVVSVFRDPILRLHTTRSWDFLEAQSGIGPVHSHPHASSDVIVGMIDTGIWPESPSFNDDGIGEIPSRWKGTCMEGADSKKFNCNRKLIGARYYGATEQILSNDKRYNVASPVGSPRDHVNHGTHTASIAAGARVVNVSYNGLARGTARGGSPSSRLAIYKACIDDGCSGSTILKAMDDAIKDGVDIISISIGMNSLFQSDYLNDPIAIGAFHAQQKGVMVVCSGGNDGPDSYTVVNSAPWIFTVAASSIDRSFTSVLVLGNGKSFQGSAITFSNLTRSRTYPLIFGAAAATNFTPIFEVSNCYPGSLDRQKVEGKIVVCIHNDLSIPRKIKLLVAEDAKAKGLILINEDGKGVPLDSGSFPFTEVGNVEGGQILSYINGTKTATATILPTVDVLQYKPAPVVAYFSSRGPGQLTENILKPDIMAPGVAILAATVPETKPTASIRNKQLGFYDTKSGTSIACPHVTGAAAFIKSIHRNWTSSMIKSALMTTASIYDNLRKPISNSSHYFANPHEIGVGEINPLKALNPGLVFQLTTEDYLRFLCYCGSPEKNIRLLSSKKFSCPRISSQKLISNINYPSISISSLSRHQVGQSVTRTVTNVGTPNSTYVAKIHVPVGLVVKVTPKIIVFNELVKRASLKISFYGQEAPQGYNFGYLTLFDGKHMVRLVFAVNVE